jgi:pseudaminic acid cytidylyltransferase
MSALCIIPARGGSRRIPRKNIRSFRGRPIISYPIAAARASGCFTEVMVSTDDPEIADTARACGAVVPFPRSERNADDFAGTEDVFEEVLSRYRELGREFSVACGLYPTAALVTPEQIRRGLALLESDGGLTAVLPVQRFSYPVQRALALRDGRAVMLEPDHRDSRSQDLEPAYHDAGQWYWFRVDRFLRTKELMGPSSAGLEISEMEAQDIDHEADWTLAELKHDALAALAASAR